MKKLWSRIRCWWECFLDKQRFEDEEYLTKADKRYLLYWAFMICICTIAATAFVMNAGYKRSEEQYEKELYDFLNTAAAYVASATEDEYEKIAEDLRDDLMLTQFNTENDIEMYMKYIVNTSSQCPLDQEDNSYRFYLVMTNHGTMQPLDKFLNESESDTEHSYIQMGNIWDEISETGANILYHPSECHTEIIIIPGRGVVSAHRMKTVYCDDCIRMLFDIFEDTYMEEIFIFDSYTHEAYPISESVLALDEYSIAVEMDEDHNYNVTLEFAS